MKAGHIYGRLRREHELRGFVTASVSFSSTIVFLIYNAFIGVIYRLLWNQSITVYYLFLVLLRSLLLFSEKRWRRLSAEEVYMKRIRLSVAVCIILAILDIALTAPVLLMIFSKREVNYGTIFAIASATYATFKVTLAVISWRRYSKRKNLSLYALKIISLKDALMSVLILQNTLISVFGDEGDMTVFTAYTSAGMLAAMVLITVLLVRRVVLVKSKKIVKL